MNLLLGSKLLPPLPYNSIETTGRGGEEVEGRWRHEKIERCGRVENGEIRRGMGAGI